MYLTRLKVDHLSCKSCCGVKFGIIIHSVGKLLWLCSKCPLVHESHQYGEKRGAPIGIPCSEVCNNFRLTVRQITDKVVDLLSCDIDDCCEVIRKF